VMAKVPDLRRRCADAGHVAAECRASDEVAHLRGVREVEPVIAVATEYQPCVDRRGSRAAVRCVVRLTRVAGVAGVGPGVAARRGGRAAAAHKSQLASSTAPF
jgi:hypothetical protein